MSNQSKDPITIDDALQMPEFKAFAERVGIDLTKPVININISMCKEQFVAYTMDVYDGKNGRIENVSGYGVDKNE